MSDLKVQVIAQAEVLVKQHMAQYDPSHDWAHVDRVRKLALKIASSYYPSPDMLVVELSALFHDLADAKYTSTSTLPQILQPFFLHPLPSTLLTPTQISQINTIIPSISYTSESHLLSTTGLTPWHQTCIELHCVQDADRLDAIGAVGVLRVACFSGVRGRKLIASPSPDEGAGYDYVKEGREGGGDGGSAEGHFYDKLLKVRDRIKTEYGRREAEKRHQTMINFLAEIDRERDL